MIRFTLLAGAADPAAAALNAMNAVPPKLADEPAVGRDDGDAAAPEAPTVKADETANSTKLALRLAPPLAWSPSAAMGVRLAPNGVSALAEVGFGYNYARFSDSTPAEGQKWRLFDNHGGRFEALFRTGARTGVAEADEEMQFSMGNRFAVANVFHGDVGGDPNAERFRLQASGNWLIDRHVAHNDADYWGLQAAIGISGEMHLTPQLSLKLDGQARTAFARDPDKWSEIYLGFGARWTTGNLDLQAGLNAGTQKARSATANVLAAQVQAAYTVLPNTALMLVTDIPLAAEEGARAPLTARSELPTAGFTAMLGLVYREGVQLSRIKGAEARAR